MTEGYFGYSRYILDELVDQISGAATVEKNPDIRDAMTHLHRQLSALSKLYKALDTYYTTDATDSDVSLLYRGLKVAA